MAKRRTPPKKDTAPRAANFNPFLKVEHVRRGDRFQLSGWTREIRGNYGPQIIVEGVLNRTGETYDFSIRKGSGNHREMFKKCGRYPHNWAGALVLEVQKGQRDISFIAITDVETDNIPF